MFMEYARNAIRMAALMKQQSIYVFTHDSIGLGEDGPTHQPVEQIASLRVTPNVATWRPADAVETVVAWGAAVDKNDGPTALILSRQNLAHQSRTDEQLANICRGGYILQDSDGTPDLILIATGSEVDLSRQVCTKLQQQGVAARLVSMPCVEVFDQQDSAYKEAVLPAKVRARLAVEAAQPDTWYRFVGLDGAVVGIDKFGESAPANELFKEYGFTLENIYNSAQNLLN
jgi:transketolase